MMMRAQTVFVALAALLWLGGVASAQQIGTCDTNGCVIDMSPPIYVLNNEWGNTDYGWGSITVDSPTSWSTSWDFAPRSDWTVISWPAAILGWQWGYRFPNTGFPVQLASHTPINTSVAFTVIPDPSCAPGGVGGGGTGSRVCRLDVAYDMWFHDTSNPGTTDPVYEMMIWLAYSRELFSGTPATAYATIGGHRWKVIQTQGGSSPVATFLLDEPADLTGATLNITEFTDWLVNNGWVSATWWLDSVQFGTEIFKGKGTLSVPCYTAAVGVPTTTDCGQTPGGEPPPGAEPTPVNGPVSINAGGGAVEAFVADADFSGGTAVTNWTGAIDTSGVINPAPQAVYQSERYGAMTYTIPGLTPGANYDVRLHFAENYFGSANWRVFNVAINGTTVLQDFDIMLATGGVLHTANVQAFTAPANASGQIVIAFTNVINYALINGIEILAAAAPPPPPATTSFTVGATTVSPNPVNRGQRVTIDTAVTASAAASDIIVDVGIYNPQGKRVAQKAFSGQNFAAGQTRSYGWTWKVGSNRKAGTYTVAVGVFDASWTTPYVWVDSAATFTVK